MQKLIFLPLIFLLSCAHQSKYSLFLVKKTDTQNTSRYEANAGKVMIVTQNPKASKAGLKIFELGGNAIDAFVAVSFAISVERPQSTGLGGGGFMVANGPLFKKPISYDFRERASRHAHKKLFFNSNHSSLYGGKAVAVPGLVKGLLEIHRKYGKLPLTVVMAPAIEMALKGVVVDTHLASALRENETIIKKDPEMSKTFLKEGDILKRGDILIQNDLAKTLKKIALQNEKGFYQGEVANGILQTVKNYDGLLDQEDLLQYQVKIRTPLTGTYKDHQIITMGPPSSGGTHLLQILNILEEQKLNRIEPLDPENIHKVATAMQLAFVDRAHFMADPDFVKIPLKKLLSKPYAKSLSSRINPKAIPSASLDTNLKIGPHESDDTTHFSIADAEGNVIASTQTINGLFGAGIMALGTGIVLNNEMDDFASKPGAMNLFGAVGSEKNLPEANKTPLSSMTPTLVYKNHKPLLVLGSPSGTRILTCVANVILNYLEYEVPLYESVALARFHHQWYPEEIRFDEINLPSSFKKNLEAKGHRLNFKNLGCQVQAIAFEPDGTLHGAADPRGEGMAIGF
jgi:gamma-glutamyltranspeptidase/glutathione hydrolase